MFRVEPTVPAPSPSGRPDSGSPQVAVLAAPAVVTAGVRLLSIQPGLAADTQSDAGDCAAARFGDLDPALRTLAQALSLWQPASRPLDGVFHARVDLILHRSVLARPPAMIKPSPG